MKEYSTGKTVVIWDETKCTHSAMCAKGLPQVFQPKNRPWIDMNGAGEKEIRVQVKKCPSGALSLKDSK